LEKNNNTASSSLPPKGEGQGMGAFFHSPYPSLFWMLFILITCLLPKRDIENIRFDWLPENTDKIVHAGFYAILAMLIGFYILKNKKKAFLALFSILIFCACYGFFIEILQHYFTTTRHFEMLDVAANSAGAFVGLIIYYFKK